MLLMGQHETGDHGLDGIVAQMRIGPSAPEESDCSLLSPDLGRPDSPPHKSMKVPFIVLCSLPRYPVFTLHCHAQRGQT